MSQDLLDEVLAHPDDDVPRRILADWLSERGDPRGELIAVQCELAVRGAHDPERRDLERRELDLLQAHGNRWITELGLTDVKAARPRGPIEHMVGATVVFRRGFPDEASLPIADAIGAMPAFLRTPLRRLVVTEVHDVAIAELAARAPIRSLTSLRLRNGNGSLGALGNGPWITTIAELALQRIRGRGVDELAAAAFPALRSLELDEIDFGHLDLLATAVWLPALRTLRIAISNYESMAFLIGEKWRDLTTLYLRASGLRDDQLPALAAARISDSLEHLELWLGNRDLRPAVIEAFTRRDNLPKLQKLVLHDKARVTDITPLVERWGSKLVVV